MLTTASPLSAPHLGFGGPIQHANGQNKRGQAKFHCHAQPTESNTKPLLRFSRRFLPFLPFPKVSHLFLALPASPTPNSSESTPTHPRPTTINISRSPIQLPICLATRRHATHLRFSHRLPLVTASRQRPIPAPNPEPRPQRRKKNTPKVASTSRSNGARETGIQLQ